MNRLSLLLTAFLLAACANKTEQAPQNPTTLTNEREGIEADAAHKNNYKHTNIKVERGYQESGGVKAENGILKETYGGYGNAVPVVPMKKRGAPPIKQDKDSSSSTSPLYKKDKVQNRHDKMMKKDEKYFNPMSGQSFSNPATVSDF